MKRILFAALLLCTGLSAAAQKNEARARELLDRLAARFASMPSYTVRFEVASGTEGVSGEYVVAGDRYHISVAGNEVYGDDTLRREIDAANREIVVDAADTASRNILTNPTRAFGFVGGDYAVRLEAEEGGRAVVALAPHRGAGTITLTLDRTTALPEAVAYDVEGDRVTVRISDIACGGEVPVFDASKYAGYETIDFR